MSQQYSVPQNFVHISSRSAILERYLAMGGVSVRPSVCLLHAGIDSN